MSASVCFVCVVIFGIIPLIFLRLNLKIKIYDGVFSSAELGYKKPDLKFFEIVLEKLKFIDDAEPDEVWFWDDEEKNVAAAREVGMKADVYRGFEEFEEKVKDLL